MAALENLALKLNGSIDNYKLTEANITFIINVAICP